MSRTEHVCYARYDLLTAMRLADRLPAANDRGTHAGRVVPDVPRHPLSRELLEERIRIELLGRHDPGTPPDAAWRSAARQ